MIGPPLPCGPVRGLPVSYPEGARAAARSALWARSPTYKYPLTLFEPIPIRPLVPSER